MLNVVSIIPAGALASRLLAHTENHPPAIENPLDTVRFQIAFILKLSDL